MSNANVKNSTVAKNPLDSFERCTVAGMAESEVRRSGRRRIVSTRLKDMQVATKSPRGNHYGPDVVIQDESPRLQTTKRDHPPRKEKHGQQIKISLKEKVENEKTEKEKLVSSATEKCSYLAEKKSLHTTDAPKYRTQIKSTASKDTMDEADKCSSRPTDCSDNCSSGNTGKAELMDCTETRKTADIPLNDNHSKVGSEEMAESCRIVGTGKDKPQSLGKNIQVGSTTDICTGTEIIVSKDEVGNTVLLEIGTGIAKSVEIDAECRKEVIAVSENDNTEHERPVSSENSIGSQSYDTKIGTRIPKRSPDRTEQLLDTASKPGSSDDAASEAVGVLASYNLTEFPEATVTRNEKGELVLSFDGPDDAPIDGPVDEPADGPVDGPSVGPVIPRVTASGWECTVEGCHYSTSRRVNWYKHQRVHTGARAHPCDKCPYVAKTTSNLKRHQMIHSNVKQYVCHMCEDTFRQKIHLKRHMRYKHESKRVQCAYCEYRCANVNPDLRIHMRRRHLIHINEEAARVLCSCKECGFVAPSQKDLAQHMKFHRPGPELKLFCEYCSFVTDCSSRLTRHLLIHTKERPYQCGLCDYRASQKQHVVRHMRTKHCVEAERTVTKCVEYTKQQLFDESSAGLSEIIDGAVDNSEVASQPTDSSQVTNADDQDMEVSNPTKMCIPDSLMHPTADVIGDGLRVLIEGNDEKFVTEERSIRRENTVVNEISTENHNTLHAENVELENLTNVTNSSSHEQDKCGQMGKAMEIGPTLEEKNISSPMVSLFQPSDLGKDKVFACSYCTMKFSKLLNLHKHLALQHKEQKAMQSLSCCLCDYSTDRKANLLIHMRKHNVPRKHQRSLLNNNCLPPKSGKSLQPGNKNPTDQAQSSLQTKRVYKCVLCKRMDTNLQDLFKHIEQKHGDTLNSSGGQEPGAFCVVHDVPAFPSSKDSQSGYQRVMVEMWPGSPAQLVDIESPWHQQETDNSTELIQGLQALADQATNSNALSAAEVQAVCNSSSDKCDNIQVPAEQLMNLSSGDYIEIDGEMYKVEFSD